MESLEKTENSHLKAFKNTLEMDQHLLCLIKMFIRQ